MKPDRIRKIGLVLMSGMLSVTVAQAQSPSSPAAPQQPPAQTEPAQPEISNDEAMHAMGYYFAQQFRLNIGFSDEELAQIQSGIASAVHDEPPPDNFMPAVQKAHSIYNERMEAWKKKDDAQRAEEATKNKADAEAFIKDLTAKDPDVKKTDSGLYYKVLEPGNADKKPGPHDRVKVNYTGKLLDGTVFDQSPEGQPVAFGVGQVVKGFSEGLQLIGEGGKIRLYIPSDLAYGDNPPRSSKIKPGSMLIFDVDELEVIPAPEMKPQFMPKAPGASAPGSPPNLPHGVPPPPPPNMKPPGPPPNFIPPPRKTDNKATDTKSEAPAK